MTDERRGAALRLVSGGDGDRRSARGARGAEIQEMLAEMQPARRNAEATARRNAGAAEVDGAVDAVVPTWRARIRRGIDAGPPDVRTTADPGFPEAVVPYLYGRRLRSAPPESVFDEGVDTAYALRPFRVAPGASNAVVVLERLSRVPENDGVRIEADAVAFSIDRFAAQAPDAVAAPERVFGEVAPSVVDDGDRRLGALLGDAPAGANAAASAREHQAVAARLLARLAAMGAPARAGLEDADSATAFWRGVGALLAALPAPLRPLLAASSGLRPDASGPWLAYAARQTGVQPPSDAAPTLDGLASALAEAPPIPWDDAADATATLRSLLMDAAEADPQRELRLFLTDVDAPPVAAPLGADARAAFLRRVIDAAHSGVAFGRATPRFGRARALGLLACAFDDASQSAWESVAQAQPTRTFWSAMLLRTPDWIAPSPIGALTELSRLLEFDAELRRDLPPDVATPLEGPAFAKRLLRLAERGAAPLDAEPLSLTPKGEGGGWSALRPGYAAAAPGGAATMASALDAIERAAAASGEVEGVNAPVERVRGALGVAAAPLDDDAEATVDGAATRAVDIAERWRTAMASSAPTAPAGAAFWERAFGEALSALQDAADDPGAAFEALSMIEREAASPERDGVEAAAAIGGALREAGLAATRRVCALEDAEARLAILAPAWLDAEADGSATAAALGAAARDAVASASGLEEALSTAAATIAQRAEGGSAGRRQALRTGAALLDLCAVAPAAAWSVAAAAVAALDAVLDEAAADDLGAASGPDPEALAEAVDAAIRFCLASGASDDADEPAAPAAPAGAVAEAMAARLGPALADYVGRPPSTSDPARRRTAAPSATPVGAADAARAVVDAGGRIAERALARNAVAAWRAHYGAALAARGDGAPPSAISLSPHTDPARFASNVDERRALAAIAAVAAEEADADALIGADVAWTVRQFQALPRPAKERPRQAPAFEPAPEAVRRVWAAMAEAHVAGDRAEAPGGADGFFLCFATKLFAEAARLGPEGATPIVASAPAFFTETTLLISEGGNEVAQSIVKWLRDHLYLERPGERSDAVAALSPDDMAARLDRALLFLNLVKAAYDAREASSPSALWEATPMPLDAVERLDPHPRIMERLALHLSEDRTARGALAWTSDRALLYMLPGWGTLKSTIYA